MKKENFANFVLLNIVLLWGLTFPVIKTFAANVNPSAFVTARFLIAALVLIPFLKFKKLFSKQTLVAGIVLGVLNTGVYILQTYALGYIGAARCAFLTGAVIIWVPLFRFVLFGIRINFANLIAGLICIFGLWILTGAKFDSFTRADLAMMIAEAFFALSLLYLEKIDLNCINPFALTFYQLVFTGLVSLIVSIASKETSLLLLELKPIIAILFCGIFATALTILLQTLYQRHTTSEFAAIIYSTESLWAAIFAIFLFGEVANSSIILGGFIIICSVMFPQAVSITQNYLSKIKSST